tara:strand:+ start:293 stop:526 length:234 start_codon:yes stop_codon:yes gene_type:complete
MFTNEIEWDETVTTVMDDTGAEEDVVVFIDDHGVFIRQYNEQLDKYDLVTLSHKMFSEMLEAMKQKEGFFVTNAKRV